jgi:CheY-like chemotaxis protein
MTAQLEAISKLVEALGKVAWPILAAYLLWRLFPAVLRVVQSRAFKVKVGEMEISVQEASDQLQTQVSDLQKNVEALRGKLDPAETPGPDADTGPQVKPLKSATQPSLARRLLWVDDRPSNNAFEVARLQGEGIEVLEARTTEEAMRIAVSGRFPISAVVSDMGRREDGEYRAKAGVQLITALQRAGLAIPVFVYSSQRYIERTRDDVLQAGGAGATASPVELFEMLHRVIAPPA